MRVDPRLYPTGDQGRTPRLMLTFTAAATLKGVAQYGAGLAVAFSGWLLAQVDDLATSIPQIGAATVILVAAGFVVRWTLTTAKQVEERYINALDRIEIDNAKLRDELAQAKHEADEWERKYREEWKLRVAIEQGLRIAREPDVP